MVDFYKKRCYNIKVELGERAPSGVAATKNFNMGV